MLSLLVQKMICATVTGPSCNSRLMPGVLLVPLHCVKPPSYSPVEDWRELARLVYRHLGLALIIVGAAYDKSYSDQVLTSESLSDICVLDRVGQWDINETFRVCQGAKFVVSYQSGIGIFSIYMRIPVHLVAP